MRAVLGWLALAGCSASQGLSVTSEPCDETRPDLGELRVQWADCGALRPTYGEGGSGDLYLANHRFRALFRNPVDSLTLVGMSGGTLIDAALWDEADILHEVVPLIDGGWLAVDEVAVDADSITLSGVIEPIPGRTTASQGMAAVIRWVGAPDSNWIGLEGADGLWLHAQGSAGLVDGWFWSGNRVVGHDGVLAEDLGGVVIAQDVSRVFVGSAIEAIEARAEMGSQPLQGTAAGASELRLYSGQTLSARLPLDTPAFELQIPDTITTVQAFATGVAPSQASAPGVGLDLPVGEAASMLLALTAPDDTHPMVTWSSESGRTGRQFLSVDPRLRLGPGSYTATLSAGPLYEPTPLEFTLEPGEHAVRAQTLRRRFHPEPYVYVATAWPTDRDRYWRGTTSTATWLAAASGYNWAVLAPSDEVAIGNRFDPQPFRPQLGSVRVGDGDWSIWSFPWSPTLRSGHGAVSLDLDPTDALEAHYGGPSRERTTVVDLAWLEQAPKPWAMDQWPDLVALTPPGPTGPEAWQPWYDWLDTGTALPPGGPSVWVPVVDPTLWGEVDVLRGLKHGQGVASTGPVIREFTIADVGPGDTAFVDPGSRPIVRFTLQGASDLDHVALVGNGGEVLWEQALLFGDNPTLAVTAEVDRWALLVAWNDAGTEFAATGPVWFAEPAE